MRFLARLVERFTPGTQGTAGATRAAAGVDSTLALCPILTPQTAAIREGDWKVAAIPEEVLDRRTEITGPVSRKMVINALNSGAQVYMADFEDSTSPTWSNLIEGQVNLMDAVRREIELTTAEGKHYALNDKTATLMVRPRGLHLPERTSAACRQAHSRRADGFCAVPVS